MPDEPIRVEKVRVKDLYNFASRRYAEWAEGDLIPIGKQRSLACAHNPYADERDIGLLVAYLGGRCAGYLGIMPGLLRVGERFFKVHWLSTWYVPAHLRRTSVAVQLVLSAFGLGYDLMVTGMSREAEKVYRGLGFKEGKPLSYYVLSLRRCNLLGVALKGLSRIQRMASVEGKLRSEWIDASERLYAPLKRPLYRMLTRKEELAGILWEETPRVAETSGFGEPRPGAAQFFRGPEIVDWMLAYRWTVDRERVERADRDYYFAEVRDEFKHIGLKIFSAEGKACRGFLVLSLSRQKRNLVFKVLDFALANRDDHRRAAALVVKYARQCQADEVELPERLADHLRPRPVARALLVRKKRVNLGRPKCATSPLAEALGSIEPDYCDGDTAFT